MTMSIRVAEGGSLVATDSSGAVRVIDADEIRRISNTELGGALDRLRTALTSFESLQEGAGVFGDSGPAAELASLHAGIKGVFVSTVDGVGTDLDGMQVVLSQSAANWDDADLTAAERSQALAERVEAGVASASADQVYAGAREDAGTGLLTGETLAERQAQIDSGAVQVEPPTEGDATGPVEPIDPVEGGEGPGL